MPPLTQRQAQVTDPVLSRLTQDYKPDESQYVWLFLFPIAQVSLLEGKYIRHDKSAFVVTDIRRGKAGAIRRVQRGFTDEDVKLERRSLAGQIDESDMEQARNIPGHPIRLEQREMVSTMDQVSLQIEAEAAEIAQDASSYATGNTAALAGDARWDKEAANPEKAVRTAAALVRRKCGMEPNTLVLGYNVVDRLWERDDIKDHVKHTRSLTDRPLDLTDLADYFRIERVVRAMALKVDAPEDDEFQDVWGNVAILTRSELSAPSDMVMEKVTWGACLRLEGYPRVRQSWFDHDHTSWIYPVETYDTPRTITKNAGYLFSSVIS